MRWIRKGWLALLIASAAWPASAEWHIESGSQRTLMIELFTSQGCSSCPPAEAFLNRFSQNPRLWTSFIPMAFHVDYWDYLGWKDRFALPDNAARQRRYAQLGHVRGVYTPGLLVNGRGWRPGWFDDEPGTDIGRAGRLSVSLRGDGLTVRFEDGASADRPLELHLAVLGMGLESDIRAGENAGRHSRHDFVVLAHERFRGGGPVWSAPLPEVNVGGASRLGLAAWVSRPGDPTPLQAVGGYLPGGAEN